MNIQITDSWLREYLDTSADPFEIQRCLSLCGPSIETVDSVGDDYVYDIEITSNRIDMASVFGIAQEATAILPQFGYQASLKQNPLDQFRFAKLHTEPSHSRELHITVDDPALSPRFIGVVIRDITMKQAPELITTRLERCGIQSINAVVDISNYIMLALGQPSHMFDYQLIRKATMHLRTSTKGETITTLDQKQFTLPEGSIVIEDGDGRLIDLCGIMGAANSAINEKTEEIVFMIPTYDKRRIRKTSMATGQRSVAATYFEKGLDPERGELGFVYGLQLLLDMVGGVVSSEIIDLYPHPPSPKSIRVTDEVIANHIGVSVEAPKTDHILTSLGFTVERSGSKLTITVPSYRSDDVNEAADIIEEVARVYGYHAIPAILADSPVLAPQTQLQQLFATSMQVRSFLKDHGLHEVYNYSMIAKETVTGIGEDPNQYLRIANPISEELTHMRTSLIPSLITTIANNQGRADQLRFFELSRVYYPREGDLPDEVTKLGIAINDNFFTLKGIVETLLSDLNISNTSFSRSADARLQEYVQADITVGDLLLGTIGTVRTTITDRFGIHTPVTVAELDMTSLATRHTVVQRYQPAPQTAVIHLQRSYQISTAHTFASVIQIAKQTSDRLVDVVVYSADDRQMVLQYQFMDPSTNMTEDAARAELARIENQLPIHPTTDGR